MNNDTLINVKNLSRYYSDHLAVNNISFEVKRGEVLGFLGPNGAGKSTTMQIITGNLAPSEGSVIINGYDILEQPRQAKAMLGFLPEQPPLYRELTVDEYLQHCARINRVARTQHSQAIATTKERCGLTEVGQRLIGNLSKGYQQRVGIAQAIIHSPDLVILDEPTVGLDPIQIREIRELIRELGKEHSVILSTHILPEVQGTCNRVQIINQGELVMSDTIEGLVRRMESYTLVTALRRPPESSELMALAGVQTVEALGAGRFRLHYLPQQNPAEALVQQAVDRGWGLYELSPERRSLEEIFVDITRTEHQEAAA